MESARQENSSVSMNPLNLLDLLTSPSAAVVATERKVLLDNHHEFISSKQEEPENSNNVSSFSESASVRNVQNGKISIPCSNDHLAAMKRQYDIFAQKIQSDSVQQSQTKPATKPPAKQNVVRPVAVSGANHVSRQMTQICPIPFPSLPGRRDNASLLFPSFPPMPGFGWPFSPFPNPFIPFLPPAFQTSFIHSPFGVPPAQTLSIANSNSKKRKSSTPKQTEAQIKKAREIERAAEINELSFLNMQQHSMLPFPMPFKTD